MTELTWDDLWVATEPDNQGFSSMELLGRLDVLLARDMRMGTSNMAFDTDATLARRALSTTERVLANHRRRRTGMSSEQLVEVSKATEKVLDRAAGLFRRNQCGEPYEVLLECRFHDAARLVCNDNGHRSIGSGSLRFGERDTMTPEQARCIIQSDKFRRSSFERMSHDEWLRHSEHTRRHRVAWKPAAELWASLALQLDEDLPSDVPRLPSSRESLGLVST